MRRKSRQIVRCGVIRRKNGQKHSLPHREMPQHTHTHTCLAYFFFIFPLFVLLFFMDIPRVELQKLISIFSFVYDTTQCCCRYFCRGFCFFYIFIACFWALCMCPLCCLITLTAITHNYALSLAHYRPLSFALSPSHLVAINLITISSTGIYLILVGLH